MRLTDNEQTAEVLHVVKYASTQARTSKAPAEAQVPSSQRSEHVYGTRELPRSSRTARTWSPTLTYLDSRHESRAHRPMVGVFASPYAVGMRMHVLPILALAVLGVYRVCIARAHGLRGC